MTSKFRKLGNSLCDRMLKEGLDSVEKNVAVDFDCDNNITTVFNWSFRSFLIRAILLYKNTQSGCWKKIAALQ